MSHGIQTNLYKGLALLWLAVSDLEPNPLLVLLFKEVEIYSH